MQDPYKSPKSRHLGTIAAQLCWAISSQLRHVSTSGKTVKQRYVLYMSSYFGLLTAEIRWRVWGTPANFAALNRGRHLGSAGRPSRWALAHISSSTGGSTSPTLYLCNIIVSNLSHVEPATLFYYSQMTTTGNTRSEVMMFNLKHKQC